MNKTKKIVSLVLAVMMVVTMMSVMAFSASALVAVTDGQVLTTAEQLEAAVKQGGHYTLGADISDASQYLLAADFYLDGNGYTISGSDQQTIPMKYDAEGNVTKYYGKSTNMFYFNSTDAKVLSLSNVTLDGTQGSDYKQYAIAKGTSASANKPYTVNLNNVTVKNFKGSSVQHIGALYLFGQPTATLTNCTVTGNGWDCTPFDDGTTASDIFVGSGGSIAINGGTYGDVLLNTGSTLAATATINNAIVENLYLDQTNATTASAVITDSAVKVYVDGVEDDTQSSNIIKTEDELKAACANGGKYILGNDVTVTASIPVNADTEIAGNGNKIFCDYQTKSNASYPTGNFQLKADSVKLTFSDVEFTTTKTKYICVVAANHTNTNGNNIITFNNVTAKDIPAFKHYSTVYAFSHAQVVINDSEFSNTDSYNRVDGAADVWAGAAASVTVNNSKVGEIFLNSETSTAAKATITDSEIGVLALGTATSGTTLGADVTVEDSTIGTLIAPDNAADNLTLDADSEIENTKEYININGTQYDVDGTRVINSAAKTVFGLGDMNVGNIETLGFQKKSDIPESVGSSDQETGKDIRFITHVYNPLLKAASDYGYVVVKTSKALTDNPDFSKITPNWGNGEKTISCKGTVNTLGADSGQDKYITLAVNGVTSDYNVAVRFYITINGKTYYSKYNGTSGTYTGCIAQYSDLF
ncbi:MAG: hypothetical protein IJ725_03255 [Ruminococcus sp.]|nr:hypothetical protein [Ruminococcus sp.]